MFSAFLEKWFDKSATIPLEDLSVATAADYDVVIVDWVTRRLTDDPQDPLALKLAGRYLGQNGRDARTAIAWIRANRKWLFFSDRGGYRWYVDTNTRRAARRAEEASTERIQEGEKARKAR